VQDDNKFNMAIKDGRRTQGLKIDKTNWANRLDEAPYEAYAVTCGVTFSFGGLKISNEAQVEDTSGKPIPGLFAAGELVGGIFYHNYPGGTGLTSGSVFGKIAGTTAATYVNR
jgi:tricarballylate dehydrogenase